MVRERLDATGRIFTREPDTARTKYLNGHGYRVIRFWDNEVLLDIDAVLAVILEALNDPHPCPLPHAGEGIS